MLLSLGICFGMCQHLPFLITLLPFHWLSNLTYFFLGTFCWFLLYLILLWSSMYCSIFYFLFHCSIHLSPSLLWSLCSTCSLMVAMSCSFSFLFTFNSNFCFVRDAAHLGKPFKLHLWEPLITASTSASSGQLGLAGVDLLKMCKVHIKSQGLCTSKWWSDWSDLLLPIFSSCFETKNWGTEIRIRMVNWTHVSLLTDLQVASSLNQLDNDLTDIPMDSP